MFAEIIIDDQDPNLLFIPQDPEVYFNSEDGIARLKIELERVRVYLSCLEDYLSSSTEFTLKLAENWLSHLLQSETNLRNLLKRLEGRLSGEELLNYDLDLSSLEDQVLSCQHALIKQRCIVQRESLITQGLVSMFQEIRPYVQDLVSIIVSSKSSSDDISLASGALYDLIYLLLSQESLRDNRVEVLGIIRDATLNFPLVYDHLIAYLDSHSSQEVLASQAEEVGNYQQSLPSQKADKAVRRKDPLGNNVAIKQQHLAENVPSSKQDNPKFNIGRIRDYLPFREGKLLGKKLGNKLTVIRAGLNSAFAHKQSLSADLLIEEASSVRIQSFFRGYLSRKKFALLPISQVDELERLNSVIRLEISKMAQESSLLKLQQQDIKHAKKRLSRINEEIAFHIKYSGWDSDTKQLNNAQNVQESDKQDLGPDTEVNTSTTPDTNSTKENEQENSEVTETKVDEQEKAEARLIAQAKIQRFVQASIARKQAEKTKNTSATKIQSLIRGSQARTAVQSEKTKNLYKDYVSSFTSDNELNTIITIVDQSEKIGLSSSTVNKAGVAAKSLQILTRINAIVSGDKDASLSLSSSGAANIMLLVSEKFSEVESSQGKSSSKANTANLVMTLLSEKSSEVSLEEEVSRSPEELYKDYVSSFTSDNKLDLIITIVDQSKKIGLSSSTVNQAGVAAKSLQILTRINAIVSGDKNASLSLSSSDADNIMLLVSEKFSELQSSQGESLSKTAIANLVMESLAEEKNCDLSKQREQKRDIISSEELAKEDVSVVSQVLTRNNGQHSNSI